ncbi:hypothetical protein HK096_000994 [Nowakowskiella sp. JEL0078]|nr:hypothetical protein HK096_000994 [Nowakowskiella sp. JEL0078]
MSRVIWIGVHAPGTTRLSTKDNEEKIGAINLLYAFCCALKHYLREEEGIMYKDVAPFLQHIPVYSEECNTLLAKGFSEDNGDNNRIVALEITNHLNSYISNLRDKNFVDIPNFNILNNGIGTLVDMFTQFDRIKYTPIPLAYAIHLKQIVYLYILSLPFQLLITLNWTTIPVTFITSFMLLGVEGIGGQIEDPFDTDPNDLPFDDFCDSIAIEMRALTERTSKLSPNTWVLKNKVSILENKAI